jgi:DNA phosphorothioation-associated putative methyltransferase
MDLSRRVKSALQDGLINAAATVFDYSCGHGQDLELLASQGVTCSGWDPAFRPDSPKRPADIVNLGFVLNVIEDVEVRKEALRQAWGLSRRVDFECEARCGNMRKSGLYWPQHAKHI